MVSSKFQNSPQVEVPVQWPHPSAVQKGKTSHQEFDFHADYPEEEHPLLESRCVLDERPLTIGDRIHKMGSEICASAAASIPRFGIMVPSSLNIRQKRDAEMECETERLRLESRFEPSLVFDGIKNANVHHGGLHIKQNGERTGQSTGPPLFGTILIKCSTGNRDLQGCQHDHPYTDGTIDATTAH